MKTNKIPHIYTLSLGVSQFIGQHWAQAGRQVLSPRLSFAHCVPGRPENIEANAVVAAQHGFSYCYTNLEEALADSGCRPHLGIITTPNFLHGPEALALMAAGIHVACDKPLAHTAKSALEIAMQAKKTGLQCAVLPTYCGFPANIEARRRIHEAGRGGLVRGGSFRYYQKWLWMPLCNMTPEQGRNQAMWRKIAVESGDGGALGDILSHSLFQLYFITGLPIVAVKCANRRHVVEGPKIVIGDDVYDSTDDDTSVVVVLSNGAEINCHSAQYSGGHRNDNSWELWLSDGTSYGWDIADHPEILRVGTDRLAGDSFTSPLIGATGTMPAFHGEGWHDAGKRILQQVGWELTNTRPDGIEKSPLDALLGLNICKVIEAVVESAKSDGRRVETGWINDWSGVPLIA